MSDYFERISQYSPKRLALLADELHSRVQELERAASEPIAIVGIGCRLPGGVRTPEAFWEMLRSGVDAIREVPPERWDVNTTYDPDPDAPGKMSTRWGSFLEDVDLFDPHFFGIAPREAQDMDPQQRILLEVAWEALEHAAISPQRLQGTRTAVYVGVSASDYLQLIRSGGLASLDAYTASGVAHSIVSGRLSYVLGVRGPSVTIDTACSSSLVAIHHAVGSLRQRESNVALAGGVNLILTPDVTVALSKARMLAPDGRCKAFDARADGFVRGEGCAILVLKRLSDAQADGDRIMAVIRGSAANQDGRSNGLTAPNGPSQVDVLRDALANAHVQARDVGYVEAHGTGTSLGDPIEVQALSSVFAAERSGTDPLVVGSVKANLGHLEAAAGVAGLIKLVMCLQHGQIPGQIHLTSPNPHIAWDNVGIRVPTVLTDWALPSGRSRIGGVSSFGFSGTNVHMVLEQALEAPRPSTAEAGQDRPAHVLTVSARSGEALTTLVSAYAKHLKQSDDELAHVAHTLNVGRAHFAHRAAFVTKTKSDAIVVLERLANGEGDVVATGVAPPRPPRIAFLFTGQGSQYVGMARGLYETQPVFRAALERCDELLRPHLDRPLLTVLFAESGGSPLIDKTEYAQPALFAVEYALAKLWMSWGIRPAVVMGHSVGEVAAACIAGVLSLEDALKLIAVRGKLMGALPDNGGMVAVRAPATQVDETIAPQKADVTIAAINGPTSVVISGLRSSLDQVVARLKSGRIDCTPLNVSHAFHSPLMRPMLAEFGRAVSAIKFSPPGIDLVSNVTGRPIGAEIARASYWEDHILSTVQFGSAVESAVEAGCDIFLEIGPQPTLLGMAREGLSGDNVGYLPSLRKGRDDWDQILQSVAELYVRGAEIDWLAFDAPYRGSRLSLPGYPFQRQRYWIARQEGAERAASTELASGQHVSAAADQVSQHVSDMIYEVAWREAPSADQPLPSPDSIVADVSPLAGRLAETNALDTYALFMPALDALASAYVVRGLRELGLRLTPGERFHGETLRKRLSVLDRYQRLFARMLDMLAEDGLLGARGDQWEVVGEPPNVNPDLLCSELLARYPDFAAELNLTCRCAQSLAAVLKGEADALPLLFPGGSLAEPESLYQNSPPAKAYNSLIAEIVSTCGSVASARRPLRILEIGAGTGSTTSYVLKALGASAPVEYTFTDVSPLFLNRAAEKFGNPSHVRFRILDAGKDPASQGFDPGSFDVVISANALHATPDLDVTLANVRSLLRPGGLLVLLEAATPQRFGDLTVGLLDGWWAYSDTHRRNYALMPREPWLKLLGENGFAEAVAFPDKSTGPVWSQQAIYVARLSKEATRRQRRYVIVPDRQGFALGIAQALRADGDVADIVSTEPPGVLAANLRAALGTKCDGVVFLPALDLALTDGMQAEEVLSGQQSLFTAALTVVQTLASRSAASRQRLWFVTRGGQATSAGESANPAQATIWGFSHVVALEQPDLLCTRMDLDVASTAPAGAIVAELRRAGSDDQIAFRQDKRLVRRLSHQALRPVPATPMSLPISADKSYLITGGLRGLGPQVAGWLVEHGARHIVLMGRSAPDGQTQTIIRQLEERGATVVRLQGDVSVRADVESASALAAGSGRKLAGVIHAAGVLDDGVISSQRWPRFATVMGPKVVGTWHIHTLVRDLDFLVLFSSGASLAGFAGQANHAAANAFEDAFAWYRQATGLPTVSINWGPWGEVGAAADRRVSATGYKGIAPADGLAALGHAMSSEGPRTLFRSAQISVFSTDWSHLLAADAATSVRPFFYELADEVARNAPNQTTGGARVTEPLLRERLQTTAANRRKTVLRDFVRQQVAKVLGLKRAEDLNVNEPLRDLGLDSLMAVELRNLLSKVGNCALPATLTFDYPSAAALAEFLGKEAFAKELGDVVVEVAATPERPAEALEALRVDELASRLAARLENLGNR